MQSIRKWVARLAVILLVTLAIIGVWKKEEILRLRAVLSLFSEDRIVANFSGMDDIFLSNPAGRAADATPSLLPSGPAASLPSATMDWIRDRSVTALVVLKDGEVVFEDYYLGTQADDLRINWSISKSYLSALMGILLDEGAINSIDDPVVAYAPALTTSAYRDASIRDVLQMSSGVTFDEDYLDFFSDINKMGRVLALGGSMDAFAAGQTASFTAPGTEWKYVSLDTHVIGMVVRGATGRSIPDLMAEKIIAPLAPQAGPFYLTDGYGVAFVLGGLNTTTRDNARFGQMIADGGRWQGRRIVPRDWIDASTVASARTAPDATGYGYQWWIPAGSQPGQFMARGIYGQYIYIDRINNVVIAVHAADRQFRDQGVDKQNEAMFQMIAESLN